MGTQKSFFFNVKNEQIKETPCSGVIFSQLHLKIDILLPRAPLS